LFERFTERARQVVVLAQEEARTLKHNYIGTEHLGLALGRERAGFTGEQAEKRDVGYIILLDFDITEKILRNEIIK
jgi:ATP-dependent Clp protease ATP-binding subunit ClpC